MTTFSRGENLCSFSTTHKINTKKIIVDKFYKDNFESFEDYVIKDEKIDFYLNGEKLISVMSIKEYQDAHIVGFLLSEAVISTLDDIKSLKISEDGLSVFVEADISNIAYENLFKQKTLTSGCCVGVTGNAEKTFDCAFISTQYSLKSSEILSYMSEFNKSSKLFDDTGCVHKARIVLKDGTFFEAEDIGRHNAIDKVIGLVTLERKNLKESILYVTGRLSNEMVVKCVMHKIPIVVSKAAVTFEGIKAANEHGVTLIGFAREHRMNVYTHSGRVKID
ncbi:formate dehydrogenase accessory sulfurtransferase FdhD [Aliarcobacter butzleri]|uniref:formate dehydrogenase accessory sulfurtransferase FdhD n=1 Tax=Aliarcobacter butzleri TaxID=28197 RepID=UPI0001F0FD78|nr:formate dehydrogenase accessory sulfurtransferase FdhD [Aliarcobacter butzleri]EFU68920.1 FdhD-like protein [Aliarcobacter butzleri JV22]KLD96885.1 formate dehydrogenase accessory protein FdhD [Aliarcobacter butzleri L349]MCG3663954.1 formate dehydrogenase accessory sulfurtransferase FdhD [Aliarcobacter butzleri]MCG3679681.1 formate dehydrogenase accessory sulfurtransferase FdhD [Aliarcobacter butzleri]MCG3692625.1 formate dehydrogenase accessory sulfurtransferase FdhD [Aliarcobacter butzle